MTWEQYWYGEPEMTRFFRKAHYLRIENDNAGRWMQGAYNYYGQAACLSNMFAKKSSKSKSYLEKPFTVLPKSDEQRMLEAERERKRLVEMLNSLERAFNGRGG